MFKSARWRSDKNKIKAVFKLQFHATQLSQTGGDALMISVIPADAGKPTAKLEKVKVQNGSCYWEEAVYETVKFVQDPKTGKIKERIYHFVLATGSSKFGVVGEVSIDFANYAEAAKLSTVSLPLKSKTEALLHVSIQRMQDSIDHRDVDESETASVGTLDRSLMAQFSNGEVDDSVKSNPTEDGSLNDAISHVAELKGNRNRQASSGSDITLSSSGSSSGFDTPREPGTKNNEIHENSTSLTIYEEHQTSQWEWLEGSAPDVSTDDSSVSPRETLLREISEEGSSDIVIAKLKSEIAVLARQAEVSELELQTLRKQIVKENKRGQDLSRELVNLKEERDAFKEESEKLKAFQKRAEEKKVNSKLLIEGGDPWALLEEMREELNYEKDLNSNLRLQLQKTQESNAELLLAVHDLDEMLEQKNTEVSLFSNAEELRELKSKCDTDDEEQKELEELVKEHSGVKEAYELEQKIKDLYGEIELYRKDKDELEMQMEQLALDYEILKQENHDISYKLEQSQLQEQLKMQYECSTSYATVNELEAQIESLESELKVRSKEFADSLVSVKELEAHVKSLEEELEVQAQGFEADLEDLMRAKIEQEQRAIRAEETLRKTRLQNANTAERLQEEFRRLSMQMASTFDANEKVALKAMNEANELRQDRNHLKDMLKKAKEDLESLGNQYEARMAELSKQIALKTEEMEKMQKQIEDMGKDLEQQNQSADEIRKSFSSEIEMHKAEIERLTGEKKSLEGKLEHMKASKMETEILVERGVMDRKELEYMVALVKTETERSIRGVKDEKETAVGQLQSEVEALKAQCNGLQNSLLGDDLEREKLRKQVVQLKSDLKKKEEAFVSIEKNLKESNNRATLLEGSKSASRNIKAVPVARGSKEVSNLKEKIKLLEGQIKLKETALESSENTFLEKEKDLQRKIEELERRMEVLNQKTAYELKQVAGCTDDLTSIGLMKMNNSTENFSQMTKSNDVTFPERGDLVELSNEMILIKEKNKSMEDELKELQERYSEISLKFAEVEGERQQLVMTLRNLKNAKKMLMVPRHG